MIVSTMNWPKEGVQDDGTYVAYKYYANSTRVKTYVVLPDKATYYIKRSGCNKERIITRAYLNAGYDPNADKLDYLIGEFKTDSFNQLHWLFDQYLDPKQRSKWGKYKVRTKGDLVKLPLCLGLVQLHKSDWCCKLNPDWFPELESPTWDDLTVKAPGWTQLKELLNTSYFPKAVPAKGWLDYYFTNFTPN